MRNVLTTIAVKIMRSNNIQLIEFIESLRQTHTMQTCSRLMEGPMRRHFEFGLIASGRIVHCLCQRPKQSALDDLVILWCFMIHDES